MDKQTDSRLWCISILGDIELANGLRIRRMADVEVIAGDMMTPSEETAVAHAHGTASGYFHDLYDGQIVDITMSVASITVTGVTEVNRQSNVSSCPYNAFRRHADGVLINDRKGYVSMDRVIVLLNQEGICPICGEEWDMGETHGECENCSDERLPTEYACNDCGHTWEEIDYTDGYGVSICPLCNSFDVEDILP